MLVRSVLFCLVKMVLVHYYVFIFIESLVGGLFLVLELKMESSGRGGGFNWMVT